MKYSIFRRIGRVALKVVVGLLVILAIALAWLINFRGYAISDASMLWRMMHDGGITAPSPKVISQQLIVPSGFKLTLFAKDLPSARLMVPTINGDLVLIQPRGGLVILLQGDRDGDGISDGRRVLFSGLDRPNGIDLHEGWLYIGEATRVSRTRFDSRTGTVRGALQPLVIGLTADGNHWRKTTRIGPDGAMYLGQGSTCNVCVERDSRRATIMRIAADGSSSEIFATGLRNPYGFDWAPWNGALYATENGRDLLGDDLPPDELNLIKRGGFYGWPYIHGTNLPDPEFSAGHEAEIARALPPAFEFSAHNAPLGIRFLRHPARGLDFERSALVALHGSWNRSEPDGYSVVSLHWGLNGVIIQRPFLTGFRSAAGLIGRPVDVSEGIAGEIYVSDDYAGAIYKITRLPASN